MSGDDVREFFQDLGIVLLWSFISVAITVLVFEALNRRYQLVREIFEENSVAAAVLAGSFVLGLFYTISNIVSG